MPELCQVQCIASHTSTWTQFINHSYDYIYSLNGNERTLLIKSHFTRSHSCELCLRSNLSIFMLLYCVFVMLKSNQCLSAILKLAPLSAVADTFVHWVLTFTVSWEVKSGQAQQHVETNTFT